MNRRTLFKAATGAALTVLRAVPSLAADVELQVSPSMAGPEISPHLYGHFIEHLGGVIYDGIWVGRDSKIANTGGIRRQFIDDMKRIAAPNVRWPGGCFADGYHWRDGIGTRRPRTYNFWQSRMPPGTQATETNEFGIHEFISLCRLVGAEPYVAANVGSGSPREFHDWVSYCNAPAGTLSLADERAANGDREPFGVKYWGVGNESWGCGGTMRPAEYAAHYRRFVTQFPVYTKPFLVATGPRGHSADEDLGWTTGFFEAMRGARLPDGFSIHFYTDLRPTQVKAGTFNAAEWNEVLLRGARLDRVIQDHWNEMARFDPKHQTKLVIDEWGVWYPPGSEIAPEYILSQTITLRDAVHTGMALDIFNRHADKIAMANVAQTVNCIHSLFLAKGAQYCRTPVFYVFEMYRAHMGGRSVAVQTRGEEFDIRGIAGPGRLPTLSTSVSVQGRRLTATITNPSLADFRRVRLRLTGGAAPAEARGLVLTHAEMTAANTFADPQRVKPAALPLNVRGDVIELTAPAKSVLVVEVRLS